MWNDTGRYCAHTHTQVHEYSFISELKEKLSYTVRDVVFKNVTELTHA